MRGQLNDIDRAYVAAGNIYKDVTRHAGGYGAKILIQHLNELYPVKER